MSTEAQIRANRKYRAKPENKIKASKYRAEYVSRPGIKDCKETVRQRRVSDNLVKYLIDNARKRSKKKGIGFALKEEDIFIPMLCPVLRIPLIRSVTGKSWDNSPSLDRIDPNKGYTKENTRVISWRANSIKKNADLSELKAIVAWLEGELLCQT